jgi:hypothetical protein
MRQQQQHSWQGAVAVLATAMPKAAQQQQNGSTTSQSDMLSQQEGRLPWQVVHAATHEHLVTPAIPSAHLMQHGAKDVVPVVESFLMLRWPQPDLNLCTSVDIQAQQTRVAGAKLRQLHTTCTGTHTAIDRHGS